MNCQDARIGDQADERLRPRATTSLASPSRPPFSSTWTSARSFTCGPTSASAAASRTPSPLGSSSPRADAQRTARTEFDPVGLESTVLLRVRLNRAACVERAVVADGNHGPLGHDATIVEEACADPHAMQAQGDALEGGAVEHRQLRAGRHLPVALMVPKVRIVDRALPRPQRLETGAQTLDQDVVANAHENREKDGDGGDECRWHDVELHIKFGHREYDQGHQERIEPMDRQEQTHGPQVVLILGGEFAGLLRVVIELEVAVARHGARNLEAG